jgi:hypothetical protein
MHQRPGRRSVPKLNAMTARLVLGTLLVLALIGAIVTLPAANGYPVHCTDLDRVTCQQTWTRLQAGGEDTAQGIIKFIPITGVTFVATDFPRLDPWCGTLTIHRFGLWDDTKFLACRPEPEQGGEDSSVCPSTTRLSPLEHLC